MTRKRRMKLLVAALLGASAVGAITAVAYGSGQQNARSKAVATVREAPLVSLGQLRIFSRPQRPAEHEAAVSAPVSNEVAILTAGASGVPAGSLTGSSRADQVRIAATGLGTANRTLYLTRTTSGRTCAGLTDFTAGCLNALPADTPVEMMYGGGNPGEGPIIWGVARNDVRRVEIVANGEVYPATLVENGYFFQLPDPDAPPEVFQMVKVTLANGQVVAVPVA